MIKKNNTFIKIFSFAIAVPLILSGFATVVPQDISAYAAETSGAKKPIPHTSVTRLKEKYPDLGKTTTTNTTLTLSKKTEAEEDKGVVGQADLTAPGSPIELRAFPATQTASDRFTVFWTHPSDPSGIDAAYYKFDTPPTHDTDGTRVSPVDDPTDPTKGIIADFSTGGRTTTTMYVWLEDRSANTDYTTNVSVILRPEGSLENILRVSGPDRYATAAQISKKIFPVNSTASAVFIANGTRLADALAAVPVAFQANAPILLSKTSFIPSETWSELVRVLPAGKKIYIAGGTAVIDAGQEQFYRDHGYSVERIAGATREITSVKLTEKLDALRGTAPTSIYLANSRTLVDALSVGSPAAFQSRGVLLTEPGDLTQNVRDYVNNNLNTIGEVTLVGGTAAIPAQVAQLFIDAGYIVKRVDGVDRYHTSRIIADWFTGGTPASPAGVALASNDGLVDSLPAAVHAAAQYYPIILVRKEVADFECLNTADYLQDNHASIEGGYAYGGTGVLSVGVESSAEQMIAGTLDLACGNI